MAEPAVKIEDKKELKGLGGVLILVMIGLFFSPIIAMAQLSRVSELEETVRTLGFLTVPDIYFSVAKFGYAALTVFGIILLVLFFRKKKIFVLSKVGQLVFAFGLMVVLSFTVSNEPVVRDVIVRNLGINAVVSGLWILYFLKSKRVKNTFIN